METETEIARGQNVGSKGIQVISIHMWYDIYIYPIPILEVQILTAICVCMSSMSYAANSAVGAAMIYAFEKDSDDQITLTLEEASWLRKRKAI